MSWGFDRSARKLSRRKQSALCCKCFVRAAADPGILCQRCRDAIDTAIEFEEERIQREATEPADGPSTH